MDAHQALSREIVAHRSSASRSFLLDASRLRGLHLDTSHAVGQGGSYEEPTQACTMTDDYVRIGSAAQQVT